MLDHTTLRRASFGLAALVLLLMALSLTAASAVQAAVPLAASAAKIATPAPSGSPTITPAPSAVCGPQGWRVISSPNPSTVYDGLFAVGVVAPNDIWAAGAWEPSPGALVQPLLEHWNGTSWSVVPNPGTAPEQSQFFAIGVVNATDMWAAGYVRPAQGIDQTLFEHWNGSAWTISPGSRLPSDTNGKAHPFVKTQKARFER